MIWKGLVCALILTRLAPAASTWPPQLEMRVPLEPTAFPWAARLISASDLTLRFGKQLRLPCPGAVGRIGQLGVDGLNRSRGRGSFVEVPRGG